MQFIRRFAYYLGGFTIGIIMVIFFLSGKGVSCAYFPNARVLNELNTKKKVFTPEALQFFESHKIDTIAVSKLLRQGKVHFNQSQTDRHQPCREYVISGSHRDHDLQIEVKRCQADSLSVIQKAGFKPE